MSIVTLAAVAHIFKDNGQHLDKFDPLVLIGEKWKLWPEGQDVINVPAWAGYFTTLPHLLAY